MLPVVCGRPAVPLVPAGTRRERQNGLLGPDGADDLVTAEGLKGISFWKGGGAR